MLGFLVALLLFPVEPQLRDREVTAEELTTTVYFDYGSNALGSAGRLLVNEAAERALSAGFTEAQVVGHADRAGPRQQNYETGLARAEAVSEALVAAGFDPADIDVESAGESDPAVFYEDERREPRNRRAVITFAAPPGPGD